MGKKENRDGKRADVPWAKPDPRSDRQREVDRITAKDQIEMIRKKCGILRDAVSPREVQKAVQDHGPNISTIDLAHTDTGATHCRCGTTLSIPREPAWKGILNPPKVCKPCGELPATCTCQPMQRPQPSRKPMLTREPEVLEPESMDSPGDEKVPF